MPVLTLSSGVFFKPVFNDKDILNIMDAEDRNTIGSMWERILDTILDFVNNSERKEAKKLFFDMVSDLPSRIKYNSLLNLYELIHENYKDRLKAIEYDDGTVKIIFILCESELICEGAEYKLIELFEVTRSDIKYVHKFREDSKKFRLDLKQSRMNCTKLFSAILLRTVDMAVNRTLKTNIITRIIFC